jgi:hypothetical protein
MGGFLQIIGLKASPEEMELIKKIKNSDVEIVGRGTIRVIIQSSKSDDKHRKELQERVRALFEVQEMERK